MANDDTGGWQLGDLDLSEYLDRYCDQRLVLIIAPAREAEPATYTCGVCNWPRHRRIGVPPRTTAPHGMTQRWWNCLLNMRGVMARRGRRAYRYDG